MTKDNKKVKREEREEATRQQQDNNGRRRTRRLSLLPPAPAFEGLWSTVGMSIIGDISSLIDEHRQFQWPSSHVPVRPLYRPPIRTLDMYTPEERLRHERCRAYALHGTKTPSMIAAEEKKKAAKNIAVGTTDTTGMTTKKTAPITVSPERIVAVEVEVEGQATNASSTSTSTTFTSASITTVDAVVKKEQKNAMPVEVPSSSLPSLHQLPIASATHFVPIKMKIEENESFQHAKICKEDDRGNSNDGSDNADSRSLESRCDDDDDDDDCHPLLLDVGDSVLPVLV